MENSKLPKLISYCIYIYLILKQFYIFKSGTIQIADYFIIIGFFIFSICIIKHINFRNLKNNVKTKQLNKIFPDAIIKLCGKMCCLSLFIIGVILVSTIYSIIYKRLDFIHSASFYIFNFIGIILFYYCIMENENFINNMRKICIFNIYLQFIICVLKIGRMYGIIRYMGTFNDPNQFAFFIFSTLINIYIINRLLRLNYVKKINYKYIIANLITYTLSGFLIIKSSSLGVIAGLLIFALILIIDFVYFMIKNVYLTNKKLVVTVFSILIILIFISLLTMDNFNLKYQTIEDNYIIIRATEKIHRINVSEGNIFQERGYDKILNYPYKIILGAGHGYNERYNSYHTGEIHATFPSILFYYGVIPFICLCIWIWKNIKFVPNQTKLIYLSVLIESLTLLNQRQLLFWTLIILGSLFDVKEEEQIEEDINNNSSV